MFDEPSSYLDVRQRLTAARVIRELLTDQKFVCFLMVLVTLLFVTYSLLIIFRNFFRYNYPSQEEILYLDNLYVNRRACALNQIFYIRLFDSSVFCSPVLEIWKSTFLPVFLWLEMTK